MQSSIRASATAMSGPDRRLRKLLSSPLALFSGGIVILLLLCAAIGPLIYGGQALEMSADRLAGPSAQDWLGTDELGRSVLVQMILGSRTSLFVGLAAAVSATVAGALIGAVSGFGGRGLDNFVMRITEIFQVMPSFVLAAVIVALWGPGMGKIVLVIALLSWPQTARMMRGEVLRIRSLDYVAAAQCLGMRPWEVLWREVVPNAIAPVITLGTLIVGQAILLEAGLAFFGLGSPDVASWGKMLNSGQRFFYQAWWLSVFPGVAIFVTVLAFNLAGDKLAEVFNPRSEH